MSHLLALASAMLYGVADFSGGLASRTLAPWRVVAWSQLIGIVVLVPGIIVVGWEQVTGADMVYGSIGGVAGLIGVYALYRALAEGTMSVVSPLTASLTAVLPLLAGLLLGETVSRTQWIGILVALIAIVLVVAAPSTGPTSPRVIGLAILAAVSFAAFFVLIGQTNEGAGMWPLVGARALSLPIAFVIASRVATIARPTGKPARVVAIAGCSDMGANIALLLAFQTGPLGVNSVISALYPAFTVLAAVIVVRERPRPIQVVGIALALVAVALLAL